MPTAILSEPYAGRPSCNNCCGCLMGCPRDAIGNPAVTHWPRAVAAGAELRTGARVERIETDAVGRATGVTYVDLQTKTRHFQPADNVVLSANGIGTPRLLLLSRSEAHPDGLANRSDQVGRNLIHHVLAFVEMWFEEPTENFKGAVSASVICEEFAETDPERGFVNGITLHMIRRQGPAFQALGGFSGKVAPWGERHHDWFDRRDGHYAPPAWHLLGTARMGSDPMTSVVDKWHRAWDCPNLRIIDGSVMTTGGGINPTSTISALAYRAAERLLADLRDVEAEASAPA